MANGETASVWHVIWTAVASLISALFAALVALFAWNWRRLQAELDAKATLEAVEMRHAENLEQFRHLISRFEEFEAESRKHRYHVNGALAHLALDVAVLTERGKHGK